MSQYQKHFQPAAFNTECFFNLHSKYRNAGPLRCTAIAFIQARFCKKVECFFAFYSNGKTLANYYTRVCSWVYLATYIQICRAVSRKHFPWGKQKELQKKRKNKLLKQMQKKLPSRTHKPRFWKYCFTYMQMKSTRNVCPSAVLFSRRPIWSKLGGRARHGDQQFWSRLQISPPSLTNWYCMTQNSGYYGVRRRLLNWLTPELTGTVNPWEFKLFRKIKFATWLQMKSPLSSPYISLLFLYY